MTMPWQASTLCLIKQSLTPLLPACLMGLCLMMLVGCSPAEQRQLTNYSERLERVTAIDIPAATLIPVPTVLPARSLLHPMPDIRLDLLDAWATRHCGLDKLIAERNSSLGRVQSQSKRLHYELQLLYQLETCVQHDDISPELQQQLSSIQQQKITSIELSWFNMLHAEQTLRQQMHGISRLLPLTSSSDMQETQAALQQLNLLRLAIFNQQWQQAATIDIEAALAILHRFDTLAVLQYSQRYLAGWLDSINDPLLQLDPAQLCPQQRSTEQLTILSTVFITYFAEGLQPYFTLQQRYYQALWPELEQLYQSSPMLPVLQQRFHQSHKQLQSAILQHVGWWQQLNQQCPVELTKR